MDVTTLVILLIIGNSISALIFLTYSFSVEKREKPILFFTFGKIFQAISWSIFLTHRGDLSIVPMCFGQFFQYFGLISEIIGLVLTIYPLTRKQITTWFSITGIVFIVYCFTASDIDLRVIITSFVYLSFFTFVCLKFLKSKQSIVTTRMVGILALLYGLSHLCRGILTMTSNHNMEIFNNNIAHSLVGTITVVVTFIFPIFLLLLMKDKDNEHLVKLNATKVKFFRIIGHDLRAPLSQLEVISQLIEIKKEHITASELEKLSNTINDSAVRTSKLLDDILTWAKVDGESIKTSPSPLIIKELIQNNIKLLQQKSESKHIHFIDKSSSNHICLCDSNIFNTILRNLFSNALKFSFPNSSIEINSSIENQFCIISIKDSGVGISSSKTREIFKMDSDYTTLGTDKEKGTGIGLSLCKEFVEKSNGKIWVNSVPNKGTTFYFSLPVPSMKQ